MNILHEQVKNYGEVMSYLGSPLFKPSSITHALHNG